MELKEDGGKLASISYLGDEGVADNAGETASVMPKYEKDSFKWSGC
jgi:hypothetical protein